MAGQTATKTAAKKEETVKAMAGQTATKTAAKKEKTARVMELPRYHFLFRIVGQRPVEGLVIDGPSLDAELNSWLTDYDVKEVHYMGQYRDQAESGQIPRYW